MVFSAGNKGPEPCSIIAPKEAKNPIIVGCSLTYRPEIIDGDSLDNIKGVWKESSRGPAEDGRILPTVVAPGAIVTSAWSQSGNADAWHAKIIPDTENKYILGGGTSFAAPLISGCCALIMEWWRRNMNTEPSLALIKAILINTAEDLAGGPSGRYDVNGKSIPLDPIPNNDQGWGLVNLRNIFKGASRQENIKIRLTYDQINPFTSEGAVQSFHVTAIQDDLPLKITLVWTDAPGATDANPALINDLDLEVLETSTGSIYKGNVFNSGYSVVGGDYDHINNIECVYIEKPVGGYEVNIIAFNLLVDAKPPFDYEIWQDYALVIDNAKEISI